MKHTFSERLAQCGVSLYFYVVPVVVWMGVIFLLSAQPSLGVAGQHISLPYLLVRKGAHIAEYFILGALSFRLFRHWFPHNTHIVAAGTLLISLPFAISDEAHQLFVTGRQGRVSDIVIDATGIFLSLIFCLIIFPWWMRKKGK
ncbi:MAG: VanZ family protein [Candidatus Moraniibacteriota bacterium]|nr:MAG: VanZ family protein [Candidatus Moranbacteria bacterium]